MLELFAALNLLPDQKIHVLEQFILQKIHVLFRLENPSLIRYQSKELNNRARQLSLSWTCFSTKIEIISNIPNKNKVKINILSSCGGVGRSGVGSLS